VKRRKRAKHWRHPAAHKCLLVHGRVDRVAPVRVCLCVCARSTGGSITGVQLSQGRSVTAGLQVEPGTSSWAAFVLARPCAASS
jgi:hypothetical protein